MFLRNIRNDVDANDNVSTTNERRNYGRQAGLDGCKLACGKLPDTTGRVRIESSNKKIPLPKEEGFFLEQ